MARSEIETEPRHEAATVSLVLGDGLSGERISGVKLLIGSDDDCDVRLDDLDGPSLHSIVHSDRDGVWLDVVVPDPAVHVNGLPTEWRRLHDGDTIEIGLLEMTVRICEPHSTAAKPAAERKSAVTPPLTTYRDSDRRSIAVRAMLQAALERGVTTNERFEETSDLSEDDSQIVSIESFHARRRSAQNDADLRLTVEGAVDGALNAVALNAAERVDQVVMSLEESASRLEILAGDLQARWAFEGGPTERRLRHLEESLEEIARRIDDAERGGRQPTPDANTRRAA